MALKGNASIPLIAIDIVAALQVGGYIDASENFDEAKFQDVSSDGALATAVIAALEKHGVTLPANAQKVIAALPFILPLIESLTK